MIVRDHIKDTTLNVTEYCKKDFCWTKLKSRKPSFSAVTKQYFSSIKGGNLEEFSEIVEARERKKKEMHDELAPYLKNSDKWFELAKWGKETKFLQPWQNSMSFNVGKNISNGKESSEKLLYQVKKIIKLAKSKGFDFSDE